MGMLQDIESNYGNIIKEAESTYGLPVGLLTALIAKESGGDANAKSKTGAGGLTQLMPATAESLGVTNVFDPRQNIFGGAKHLATMLKNSDNDIRTSLYKYNAGAGNYHKYGWDGIFEETSKYIPAVMDLYSQIKESTKMNNTIKDTIQPAIQDNTRIINYKGYDYLNDMKNSLGELEKEDTISEMLFKGANVVADFLSNRDNMRVISNRLGDVNKFIGRQSNSTSNTISNIGSTNRYSLDLIRNSLGTKDVAGVEYPAYSMRGNLRSTANRLTSPINGKILNSLNVDVAPQNEALEMIAVNDRMRNEDIATGYDFYNQFNKANARRNEDLKNYNNSLNNIKG